MKERLIRHKISATKIVVAENWADGVQINSLPFPEGKTLIVLYSGNFGMAHDAKTIMQVMQRFTHPCPIHFCFAGAGPLRRQVEEFCRSHALGIASFRDYVDYGKLGSSLAECHIGLVTQIDATLGAVVPSKVYGLMAAGRPILFVGPARSTTAILINQFGCGWHFDCGDAEGVFCLLHYLDIHREEIQRRGEIARKVLEEHYDKPAGVARICHALGLNIEATCSLERTHEACSTDVMA